MAESFMLSIANRILGKLGSVALQEIGLAWGVDNEMKKLEGILVAIRAVLLDAEDRVEKSRELKTWLERLQDACHQVDDILDDFQIVALKHQLISGSIALKVRYFFSNLNPISFRSTMGHKIKKVRETLDLIAADRSKFHLMERIMDRTVSHRERETYSFLSTSDAIGREKEKDNIIKLLMESHSHQNVQVLPIVGIGGLGKTTLARMVFNDPRVINYFDLKIWFCVSDEFDVKKLIGKIIRSASDRSFDDLVVIEQLQIFLREILKDKRFLLVMDDVWNENRAKWFELRNLLMGAGHGSKVIVTTCSHLVASVVGTIPTYNLEGLPLKECLSLFVRWAFKDGEELQHPNLMRIGEGIVKKCKGVPLAVRTLGSLLFMKTDEREWLDVRDNHIWKLEQSEGDILPALMLSYSRLPSHLKRCFAFCSIYHKDKEFQSNVLVQDWMAHDLIQPSEHAQTPALEKIGEQYVSELQSRSFFQDITDYTCFSSFKMHDLVHDLALLVAQTEYLTVNFNVQNVSQKTRHLSFNDVETFPEGELPSCILGLRNLRTVYLQYRDPSPTQLFVETCITRFKLLRMLDLSCSRFEVLPSSIGTLRHLRWLSLYHNKNLKVLPSSLCKLQHLQTLCLHRCEQLQKLPRGIGNLISLRSLYLTTRERLLLGRGIERLTALRFLHLKACINAEYLCDSLRNLTALQRLEIHECHSLISLPPTFTRLTALDYLLIRNCKNLEMARITDGQNVEGKEENRIERGGVKSALKSLRCLGFYELPKMAALPFWLLRGAEGIRSLEIVRCRSLVSLPQVLGCLNSLERLSIRCCEKLEMMEEDQKQEEDEHVQGWSGGLTSLVELSLYNLPQLVNLPLWFLQDSATTLKRVNLEELPNLRTISLLEDCQSLSETCIIKCPNVVSLPEGMNCSSQVDIVSIKECPHLVTRCQPRTGKDWLKIAQARSIYLDGAQIK